MFLYQATNPSKPIALNEYKSSRQIAAHLREMVSNGVATTPDNLMKHGYSREDISRYGLHAAHLARQHAVKVAM